jgi:cystathionine gamma-synthase
MSDENQHLDPNVPGNPAYHFTILPPGSPSRVGWSERAALVPGAQLGTRCVHAGVQPDPSYGAVMPPLYLTSTFAFRDVCTNAGYDYTRSGNPTRAALEDAIAQLEGGIGATCTSTGMSAIVVALNLLPHGSHLLCTIDCYGGTFRALEHAKTAYGLQVTYLDLSDLPMVQASFRDNTRMVWIETPSNPLLRLTDIRAVATLARARGALTVVDNTFLSPILQRPFEHGADLVVHSTTKYLNGHSDVVAGALVVSRTDLHERLAFLQNAVGAQLAPMDSFLVLRGLKTLHVRMERHEQNARAIASALLSERKVRSVNWPGLEAHPQHALAARQMSGFGGMLTFVIEGGLPAARTFLKSLRVWACAESLGGVESLIEHPAIMTHASVPEATRRALGIDDGLIRLSVGIEHAQDLVDDLRQALART